MYINEDFVKAKKYAIYLRKSTDDGVKQSRSIEDQLKACRKRAKGLNLNVTEVIEDHRSAKRSGNRSKFTDLLKRIRKGQIDGLISWHPDRLARNMKEAGEVIDLLDEGFLVDLQFASHTFVNDYNGKMTLGIAFVLSKQYSDKLSVDVKRAMGGAFTEGKSAGQYKPGYVRSPHTGYYEPDERELKKGMNQFEVVKEAWRMRLDGKSLDEICIFMNESGYERIIKKEKGRKVPKEQSMSNQKLSNTFKDPFYYGILRQSNNEVDLNTIHDFVPMISEENFLVVQQMGHKDPRKKSRHKYPFRQFLICADCKKTLTAAASKGQGGHYLSFWCARSKQCPSKGTIRAKEVIGFMLKVFEQFQHLTPEQYDRCWKIAKERYDKDKKVITDELGSLLRQKNNLERKLEEWIASGHTRISKMDEEERKVYQKHKKSMTDTLDKWKAKIAELEEKKNQGPMTKENLLNLLESLSVRFKWGGPSQKHEMATNTFLNLTIKNGKIVSARLKPPFDELEDTLFSQSGGR